MPVSRISCSTFISTNSGASWWMDAYLGRERCKGYKGMWGGLLGLVRVVHHLTCSTTWLALGKWLCNTYNLVANRIFIAPFKLQAYTLLTTWLAICGHTYLPIPPPPTHTHSHIRLHWSPLINGFSNDVDNPSQCLGSHRDPDGGAHIHTDLPSY